MMLVYDFFTQPIKAPESVATIITSESVFNKVCCLFLPSKNSPHVSVQQEKKEMIISTVSISSSNCSFNHPTVVLNICPVIDVRKESHILSHHPLSFCLCRQGVYYQTGDVIRVIDEEDGRPYYAQIRGFVQDQYCEKSAALTWLIPTQASPKDHFDPGTYIVGEQFEMGTVLLSSFIYQSCLLSDLFGNCACRSRSRGGTPPKDGVP